MKQTMAWWERYFLWTELALGILLAAGFATWALRQPGLFAASNLLAGNRAAVYAAFAAVWGSLFGFIIAAEAILVGYASSPKLLILRASPYYPQIWQVYNSAIRWLGASAVISIFSLLLDRDSTPHMKLFVAVIGSAIIVLLRLLRCIWVLESIVVLVTTSTAEEQQQVQEIIRERAELIAKKASISKSRT